MKAFALKLLIGAHYTAIQLCKGASFVTKNNSWENFSFLRSVDLEGVFGTIWSKLLTKCYKRMILGNTFFSQLVISQNMLKTPQFASFCWRFPIKQLRHRLLLPQ